MTVTDRTFLSLSACCMLASCKLVTHLYACRLPASRDRLETLHLDRFLAWVMSTVTRGCHSFDQAGAGTDFGRLGFLHTTSCRSKSSLYRGSFLFGTQITQRIFDSERESSLSKKTANMARGLALREREITAKADADVFFLLARTQRAFHGSPGDAQGAAKYRIN